jgi:hypothetical protein
VWASWEVEGGMKIRGNVFWLGCQIDVLIESWQIEIGTCHEAFVFSWDFWMNFELNLNSTKFQTPNSPIKLQTHQSSFKLTNHPLNSPTKLQTHQWSFKLSNQASNLPIKLQTNQTKPQTHWKCIKFPTNQSWTPSLSSIFLNPPYSLQNPPHSPPHTNWPIIYHHSCICNSFSSKLKLNYRCLLLAIIKRI